MKGRLKEWWFEVLVLAFLVGLLVFASTGCGVLGWFFGWDRSGGGDADKAGEFATTLAEVRNFEETRRQGMAAIHKLVDEAQAEIGRGDTVNAQINLDHAQKLSAALWETAKPEHEVAMERMALDVLAEKIRDEAPKLEAAEEKAWSLAMGCFGSSGESKLWGYVKFLIPVLLFVLTVVGSVVAGIKGTKSSAGIVAIAGVSLIVIYLLASYLMYVVLFIGLALLAGAGYLVLNYVDTAREERKKAREQEETIKKVQEGRVALPKGARTTFDAYASDGMSKETARAIRDVKDGLGI